MKKCCFIIVLSFFTFRVYGIHDLLINGSSTPTITTASTLDITASFDGSNSANVTIYVDLNNNGLDPSDPWIMKSKMIDGGFDDEDETINGVYHEIGDPFMFQGKIIFYAEDNGVSDTVIMTVNPATSSHSVSGKVTVPANKPHIFVSTIRIINIENGEFEYGCGDFTDANGNYSISMPDECANQYWKVVALDIAEVVPFYSSNDVTNDSIYVLGTVTKNIEMCFASIVTRLTGELRDDLGSLITAPAQVMGIGSIDGFKRAKPGKTDGTGTYSIFIKTASIGICFYMTQASIAGQLYPDFMNPLHKQVMQFPPADSLITINFKAYRTTNFISGYVYKDGAPYDKCHLDCSAVGYGGTYAKTFSDGSYLMPVSDSASSYTITIAKESIPEGYTISSLSQTASPGATDINFNFVGVEEEAKDIVKPSLMIHPNPFTGKIVFELSYSGTALGDLVLYDIAGKQVTVIKAESTSGLHHFALSGKQKLSSGIYFYSLKAADKTFKGKVIKLQ